MGGYLSDGTRAAIDAHMDTKSFTDEDKGIFLENSLFILEQLDFDIYCEPGDHNQQIVLGLLKTLADLPKFHFAELLDTVQDLKTKSMLYVGGAFFGGAGVMGGTVASLTGMADFNTVAIGPLVLGILMGAAGWGLQKPKNEILFQSILTQLDRSIPPEQPESTYQHS